MKAAGTGHTTTEPPAAAHRKGENEMKQKYYLTLAACLSAALLTACGSGRMTGREQRNTDVTVIHTEPATARATEDRHDAGDEAREMVSDAVQDASRAAGHAVENGKELVTEAVRDASEAMADRKGEGDYSAADDGEVRTGRRN